jgi:hypothetical protein
MHLGLVAACARKASGNVYQDLILDPWTVNVKLARDGIFRRHRQYILRYARGVLQYGQMVPLSVEEGRPVFSGLSIETLSSCSQPMTFSAFWLDNDLSINM